VFRDGGLIGALTNLCAHQGGPIGDRLEDGCAPPPFTEKLATHRVRINRGAVEVDPRPLPPGTPAAVRWRDGTE
jgi:methionine sulfoxide reductase heme-binding subunit